MRKLLSGLLAGSLALSLTAAAVAPSAAMPQPVVPSVQDGAGDVVKVADRDGWRKRYNRMERRTDRRIDRLERRDRREARQDFERRGEGYYYRGYRGYRYARPGYRHYNGYWFPAGAFVAGALITGAIVNSQPRVVVRSSGGEHVNWCYGRYRSYRASDNTFQPLSGPRQQCYSPYD